MGAQQPGELSDRSADRAVGAFEAFYQRHYATVYAYVVRRIGPGVAEATDVVAEVFTVAWRRRDQVPVPPDDVLWLYGVSRRVVSRWWRSHNRRLRLWLRLRSYSVMPSTIGSEETVADWVLGEISRLRAADQEILRLVYWEQLSHGEAGVVLGCSANAVAQRLHKIRRRLRSELEGSARESGVSFEDEDDEERAP